MLVYIDVLVLENFIVNLFLLITTMKLLRLTYKKKIYFASLIGAMYTFLIFIKIPFVTSLIGKVIVVGAMIYMTMEYRSVSDLIKGIVVFFIVSFTLCGLIFSFVLMQNQYYIGGKFSISNSSIKYMIISLMILYILIVRIVDYIRERALVKSLLYDIEISHNKERQYIKGFLDTGNELREPVTNLPCIIVERMCLENFNIREEELFYIGYKTIGEKGKLKGFKGELVRIKGEDDEWRIVNAIICSCTNKLSEKNEYNALLSRGVI